MRDEEEGVMPCAPTWMKNAEGENDACLCEENAV